MSEEAPEIIEEEEAASDVNPMFDVEGDWFFVQTLSGHEMKVQESIEKRAKLESLDDKIHRAIIPMEMVTELKDGEKVTKKKKFFPGYILLIADMFHEDGSIDDKIWQFIKETPSVTGFITDKPLPLTQAERDDIIDMMTERSAKERPKIDFNIGEVVKIKDGPFQSLDGKIEDIDPEKGMLKLSINMFGRSTQVDLGYWQVERE